MRLNLSDFKQKFDDCSTLCCSLRNRTAGRRDVKSLVRDESEKAITCVFCRDLQ